ncbi:hypothetical protein G6L26_005655 [Agrobacterium radiobacter]|jgi:hypothetical protein|uniref:Uncharacterized protein n=2 Tax=Agrobacterium tumefaciens TaxID=358 RepID=A0A822UXY5_AGRTU|nr:hypothetical protein [Agrobacterium tumefaciens]KWT81572.1 hypothetical protein ASB65_15740 [Agrobacterium tumefaciens str. B6]MQB27093.1 hypothetical protein [Agrobacterium tumefaciens]NTA04689.1 hypothetical protein [Agrobacterium tumefaciens]NTA91281.1 hypothetical protein [Agrobacterium tumefaciens]NTB12430.1 hypothetical protein [Agrobacterium tumefaciens]
MSSVYDYLGALKEERKKLVVQAAETGDLAANMKSLATVQLAIIAFEAVAYEKNAAHHFDAAMAEFKLTHGVA